MAGAGARPHVRIQCRDAQVGSVPSYTRTTRARALTSRRFSIRRAAGCLHVLRGQVGTDNFWKGIRLYYQQHRNGHATTDDLRRAMETVSGQDLKWFFSQWLTRVDAPVIDGTWTYDAGAKQIVIDLTQTQPGDAYRMPMEVGVAGDSAGAPMRIEKIEMNKKTQHFAIPADHAPSDVALDPNVWMLMEAKFAKR